MRLRVAATIILAAFIGVEAAAEDVTVRLRESDRGPWGAVLRVCKREGITKRHCANIFPLVLRDSGVSSDEYTLGRLPVGQAFVVDEKYLRPGFRPTTETIREAKEIFPEENHPPSAAKADCVSTPLDLRVLVIPTEPTATPARLAVNNPVPTVAPRVAAAPLPQSRWKEAAQFSAVAVVYSVLTWLLCLLWFRRAARPDEALTVNI